MKRFLALACILVLTFTLSACGLDKIMLPTTYKATSQLYVVVDLDLDDYSNNIQIARQLTRDVSVILESRSVLDRVIEETGTTLSVEKLQDMISVENDSDTRIITVCITGDDDQLVMDIAQALVEIGPEIAKKVTGTDVLRVLAAPKLTTAKPSWKNLFS